MPSPWIPNYVALTQVERSRNTLVVQLQGARGELERNKKDRIAHYQELSGVRAEAERARAEARGVRVEAEGVRAEAEGIRAEGRQWTERYLDKLRSNLALTDQLEAARADAED